MVEELIVKGLVSGGIGAGGGCLAAYVYIKSKLRELQNEIDAIKEARERENKEIEDVGKKLDKLLEYMPILRTLERRLSISVAPEEK